MAQVIEKNDKNEAYKLFQKEVGSRMRAFRKNQRLTQAQMAQKLGMAFVSYSSIERGVIGTTLKTFFHIAQILGVSPAQLLTNKEEILFTKQDVIKLYMQGEKLRSANA